MKRLLSFVFALLILVGLGFTAFAQDDDEDEARQKAVSFAVKQLAKADPLTRQRGAEELARIADDSPKLLVEGYRVQEKDKRVRLALDWALYRMGNPNKIYDIAKELGTSRRNQATSYLVQLEQPELLYPFLRWDDKTLIGVLGVLASIGDEESLIKIEPYTRVVNPEIVSSAKYARDEINKRLANPQPKKQTRPRAVEGTNPQ